MTPPLPYPDRATAGRTLARALDFYSGAEDLLVLALPRGGMPVGCEVAEAIGAELDVMVVRKIGFPDHPELAMGAVATGGLCLRNDRLLERSSVTEGEFRRVEQEERRELQRRESTYRGDRPPPRIHGRTVILVDDGLATGSTMGAAIRAVHLDGPHRVVVAVPVASEDAIARLGILADEVVCPATPKDFHAIGRFYREFPQLTDSDVGGWLRRSGRRGETPIPTVGDS